MAVSFGANQNHWRHSFSRQRTLTRNYFGDAHDCSTRSAKPAGRFPPHILSDQTSPTLVSLGGRVVLQT